MSSFRKAAKAIAAESNPVTFVERLKGLPLIRQILRVVDRFL